MTLLASMLFRSLMGNQKPNTLKTHLVISYYSYTLYIEHKALNEVHHSYISDHSLCLRRFTKNHEKCGKGTVLRWILFIS
jgi:hypothetical protein